MRRLALSLRMLARDWRAGELRLLAAAIVIAVGAVTAVAIFSDRLQRGMASQSAELLGADLVLVAPEPIERGWIEAAVREGLRTTEVLEFASIVVRAGELRLATIRAVDAAYPLRGELRGSIGPYAGDGPVRGVPSPGTVWVEARLLHELGFEIGGRVTIGNATVTATRVLTYEPGRGGSPFALAPRVLMNAADVAATGVIQPGSRVNYALGLAGSAPQVAAFRAWLGPHLSPHIRMIDPDTGNPTVARALGRVERYLGLTSLLAVLLAGAAIAMGARRYSIRHYDTSALLRGFGATQRDVTALHLPQLVTLAVTASVVGAALGWVGQGVIHWLLRDLLPLSLPAPGPGPFALGLLTGLILLAGFALPPVLRLRRVSPLRVLRRELTPLPPGALAVYGSAAGALAALLWRHTGSAQLTLIVFGGAAAAALVLAGTAYALLSAGRLLPTRAGVAWRFGFANLWRRPRASVSQALAFGLALLAMAIIALVRTDLLASWQRQLPPDTPNTFAFNILPDDVSRLEQFFAAHGIASQALYPMVRGRLTEINRAPVTQTVTKEERSNEAIQRELNLSWTAELPPDNEIVSGRWSPRERSGVSVESRLAERLGIAVGDELTFSIAGEPLAARVTSLRKVQWESFHPNFYMIFSPGALADRPATWLTSFHLPPARKALLAPLVREFPAVSVLETEQILAQVRRILEQVTVAVEFVLLFTLAAGITVLAAAVAASLGERLHEGALLRALGASRRQLRSAQLAEFALLGFAAGLLAALGTELIAAALYTRVFDLGYRFQWPVWLLAPVAGSVLVAAAGAIGTRGVLRVSPMAVLREEA